MSVQQRQSSSSKTVSVTSREDRHSSSLTSSSREARAGSGVLGSLNREVGSRSEDTEAAKRSGWGLKRSESQLRDRAERSASAAAASGGPRPVSRPRWSYRGSESPGKENVETGDRSRSVTRSPASRLFSSTASSRAKQITAHPEPVRSSRSGASSRIPVRSRGATASAARASSSPPQRRQRASSSSGQGQGQGQDRGSRDRDTTQLQSYTDFRQVADSSDRKQSGGLGGSKSYSSLHRAGSTGQRKSSSSSGVSTSYSTSDMMRKTSSGSGSVKISLSSLKKATVDTWDGQENVNNNSGKQGKRKSISSVYIG